TIADRPNRVRDDVEDYVAALIEQDQVAADQDTDAVSGQPAQPDFEGGRKRRELLFKAGRQRAVALQLFLESRRKGVALGQSGRQAVAVLPEPVGNDPTLLWREHDHHGWRGGILFSPSISTASATLRRSRR